MPVLLSRRGARSPRIASRTLQARAVAMLGWLGYPEHELSVLLCDDRVIRDLNKRFRDQPKATDVLAFPVEEQQRPFGNRPLLGDIAISLETAAIQASTGQAALLTEVTFLLAHGLLHLTGMDHDTPRNAAAMNRRTEAVLAAIGCPPPTARALAPSKQSLKEAAGKAGAATRRRHK